MRKCSAISLAIAFTLLIVSSLAAQNQASSPAGAKLSVIDVGLKAAQMDHKFAVILLRGGADADSDALQSAANQVFADHRIGYHAVYVGATVAGNFEAQKIAALFFGTAPPSLPALALFTPTAQGFNGVGVISGTPASNLLRDWLTGKMCGVLTQGLAGAPVMDSDLASLCSASIAEAKLPQPAAAPRQPVQPPLTPAEANLSPLTKQTPHLKGAWKGTAARIVCGQAKGTVEAALTLDDNGYRFSDSGLLIGNVSGNLTIDGQFKGVVAADYGSGKLQTNPLDTMQQKVFGLSLFNPPAVFISLYYVKLSAKDPFAGFGNYQTLAGSMFRSDDSECPQYGDEGEVLRVQLQKQ